MTRRTLTPYDYLQTNPPALPTSSHPQWAPFRFPSGASGDSQLQQGQMTAGSSTNFFHTAAIAKHPRPHHGSLALSLNNGTVTGMTSTLMLQNNQVMRSPPPQPIDLDSFSGLKFIMCDQLMSVTREIYDKISGTFQWEMCEADETYCVDYIRNECSTKRVFIIASGSLGKILVPIVHSWPQVYAIYIYCADVDFHRTWSTRYGKVRVVCNDDDKYLLPQLAVDVARANLDWGNALLKQGNKELAKKKFEKALINLTNYTRQRHDPAMEREVHQKLEQCE